MKISIIMPTYNEIEDIEKNINNYVTYFKNKKQDYEIILSCNACKNKTLHTIKNLSKNNQKIKSIISIKKTGKGKAILEGFRIAKGEIVGFVDADGAYNYYDVIHMINEIISDNYDCVIASKWKGIDFKNAQGNLTRNIFGRIWNQISSFLFDLDFRDTQGGAKFLKSKILKKIINELHCNGFEFDVELLWSISKKKYRIKEVFLKNKYNKNSSFRTIDSFSMLLNILKLKIGAFNDKKR